MSGTLSFWENQSFFNYDVLVIGSGIVGLNAAINLKEKEPGLSIAILERGFLPSGASTKNAGFACFGSISELIEQEKVCGTEGLQCLVEKRWKGLLKLRNLLGDDCIDYKNYGGYELFQKEEKELADECVSKIEYFNQLLMPVIGRKVIYQSVPEKVNIFGFKNVETLIESRYEAQIDTGKMMKALWQKALSMGIFTFNQCPVEQIDPDLNGVHLTTAHGNFFCKKLLLATNAFSRHFLPDADVLPGRGQVLVTRPVSGLKVKGTFHYEKGFYYFRNIGNRVMLGGGRNMDITSEQTLEFGLTAAVQHKLEKLLKEVILPDIKFEIEQRWSGIMAFGRQLAPIIEEVKPNVFCAIRGSGMGIAIGSQTGADAADLMLKNS